MNQHEERIRELEEQIAEARHVALALWNGEAGCEEEDTIEGEAWAPAALAYDAASQKGTTDGG